MSEEQRTAFALGLPKSHEQTIARLRAERDRAITRSAELQKSVADLIGQRDEARQEALRSSSGPRSMYNNLTHKYAYLQTRTARLRQAAEEMLRAHCGNRMDLLSDKVRLGAVRAALAAFDREDGQMLNFTMHHYPTRTPDGKIHKWPGVVEPTVDGKCNCKDRGGSCK